MNRVTPLIGQRTPIFLVLGYDAAPRIALSGAVHMTCSVGSLWVKGTFRMAARGLYIKIEVRYS